MLFSKSNNITLQETSGQDVIFFFPNNISLNLAGPEWTQQQKMLIYFANTY